MYKLTKGPLSRIRKDKAGVDELLEQGYKLDGEVDKTYQVVNPFPKFEEDPLDGLRQELISLGVAPSQAARITKEETLREKIEALKEEQNQEDK